MHSNPVYKLANKISRAFMKSLTSPIIKDLVLIGGGHAHVTVLKQFGMHPIPGVRLTLISRDLQAPYSGMLPGFIAGHYTLEEAHIDLVPLANFAGARFFHDEVIKLDTKKQQILCKNRPAINYDYLSINIGSSPTTSTVPGADTYVTPVKPIASFVDTWHKLRERVLASNTAMRICVVGGGAGGVELILAMQHRLNSDLQKKYSSTAPNLDFHLFDGNTEILSSHNTSVRNKFSTIFKQKTINLHLGVRVTEVKHGELFTNDSKSYEFDEILWVTRASAQTWLRDTGLSLDDNGFINVADTLESTSHPGVFAVGDIANVINHPRPKAGVFAVRQGKPLTNNLRRLINGQALKAFKPQKQFLSIISTGDQYAVASRSFWSLSGKFIWRWKDKIDKTFMDKFSKLPEMQTINHSPSNTLASPEEQKELSTLAMRCGGCGAKVGVSVLDRVLSDIKTIERDDIILGLHQPDDCAVVSVPENKLMVHTVDHFRSFIDDPYVFAQIAANHALGDIYAMGAEPQSALAIVTIPYGIESKIEADLSQLMLGALKIFNAANTALIGGHTGEGEELSIGFSINGLIEKNNILHKGGMQNGDKLIITKAIGTGALFAANMRGKAKGPWIKNAIDSMLLSNQRAAEILHTHQASACTDVTGFGVLGHLVEMVKASHTDKTSMSVKLNLSKLPILSGAETVVSQGIFSSLQADNLRLRRAIKNIENFSDDPRYSLLFDPQTAGGLMASVPANHAEACLQELKQADCLDAEIIGEIHSSEESEALITLY